MQAGLTEALSDQDAEYKRMYLSAFVTVMTPDVLNGAPRQCLSIKLKEAELHKCVQLLLDDLEKCRGGPELLSQTLRALTLLLSPR